MTRIAKVRAVTVAMRSSVFSMSADRRFCHTRNWTALTSADNIGNDGSWDNNAADAESSNRDDNVDEPDVVSAKSCHPAGSGSHQDAGEQQELPDATTGIGEQSKDDASAGQNRETKRQVADANAKWVVAVDVVALRRPEEDDTEEASAAKRESLALSHTIARCRDSPDGSDDQGQAQDPAFLSQAVGEHGVLGELGFPDEEADDQDCAQEQWNEHVH